MVLKYLQLIRDDCSEYLQCLYTVCTECLCEVVVSLNICVLLLFLLFMILYLLTSLCIVIIAGPHHQLLPFLLLSLLYQIKYVCMYVCMCVCHHTRHYVTHGVHLFQTFVES